VTGDGKDATNELTYLLLEVVRQVRVPQPPIYLRCHKGTPEELWQTAVEVTVERGDGNPAFLNDAAVLLNFAGLGIPIAVARDWAGGGCIHPHVCHASTGDMGQTINLAKIFELTLNNGVDPVTGKQLGLTTGDPRSFASFDELYAAFKEQVSHVLILMTQHLHMCWQLRNRYYSLPFFSALIDDCMEKGIDYMAGGCRYPQLYFGNYDRGHQNVADSLAAIKKLVYEEHRVGMDELLEALKVNFVGKETLRRALQAAPKYGNDDDYVDDIFDDLSLWMQRRIAQEKHPLGSNQRIHRGGATQHYYLGLTVGALPDGRKAFEPLADGTLSPMRGADVKGPTAVINSASKVNHNEIATSSLFNMKITRSIVRSRDGQRKLASLIKTYFNRGGYHIQFNLMGQEMLLEAKKHREKYRDLLVRVAGYSAYFVELSPEVQDEIIARCEHEL
jgi:formate C-acetyltransferase